MLNELKRAAMLTVTGLSAGHINEIEHAYLTAGGATATSLNEKWQQVFSSTATSWNGAAKEFLASQGHSTGSINECWTAFWAAGGVIV